MIAAEKRAKEERRRLRTAARLGITIDELAAREAEERFAFCFSGERKLEGGKEVVRARARVCVCASARFPLYRVVNVCYLAVALVPQAGERDSHEAGFSGAGGSEGVCGD